jgi:hypothetical protein
MYDESEDVYVLTVPEGDDGYRKFIQWKINLEWNISLE